MKTLLNLLPEEKKDAIQMKLRFRFLLWQLFLLFLLEVFYLSMLISMYLVLDYQFKSLQITTSQNSETAELTQEKRLSEFEKKFGEVNDSTDKVGKIEYSHLRFTNLFLLLDELTPVGVTMSNVSTKDYTISLFGKAAKREHLLSFDEKLKGSDCITDVNIPISSLFSQTNIDFQIDFQIKPECLKK